MTTNNYCFKSKKGNAFIGILIAALVITLFTVYVSYYFSNMKYRKSESLAVLISSDYQMESAVIMQMQKYKNNNIYEPRSLKKELIPGIDLFVKCEKMQNGDYVFETTVTGTNINRKLKIKADKEIPDKLEFLE